ncbi:MAG: hypothetical protein ABIG95_01615 [Candidatus Woesearchaeota archaeon]
MNLKIIGPEELGAEADYSPADMDKAMELLGQQGFIIGKSFAQRPAVVKDGLSELLLVDSKPYPGTVYYRMKPEDIAQIVKLVNSYPGAAPVAIGYIGGAVIGGLSTGSVWGAAAGSFVLGLVSLAASYKIQAVIDKVVGCDDAPNQFTPQRGFRDLEQRIPKDLIGGLWVSGKWDVRLLRQLTDKEYFPLNTGELQTGAELLSTCSFCYAETSSHYVSYGSDLAVRAVQKMLELYLTKSYVSIHPGHKAEIELAACSDHSGRLEMVRQATGDNRGLRRGLVYLALQ